MRGPLVFPLETPKRRSRILAEFEVLIVSVRQIRLNPRNRPFVVSTTVMLVSMTSASSYK
jgi:hypothetical protein